MVGHSAFDVAPVGIDLKPLGEVGTAANRIGLLRRPVLRWRVFVIIGSTVGGRAPSDGSPAALPCGSWSAASGCRRGSASVILAPFDGLGVVDGGVFSAHVAALKSGTSADSNAGRHQPRTGTGRFRSRPLATTARPGENSHGRIAVVPATGSDSLSEDRQEMTASTTFFKALG